MQKVVERIKSEVQDYQRMVYAIHNKKIPDPSAPYRPNPPACSNGIPIEFTISKVKMELTTTVDNTASGSVGLNIPIPQLAGTVSPSITASAEDTNTQTLDFYSWPVPAGKLGTPANPGPPPPNPGVITRTLLDLRTALIAASANTPCFQTVNDASKDPEDTFTLGITVISTGGGTFEIKLAVVDAKIGDTVKSTTGNTITVTFKPSGAIFIE
jgi:hypothetical protein